MTKRGHKQSLQRLLLQTVCWILSSTQRVTHRLLISIPTFQVPELSFCQDLVMHGCSSALRSIHEDGSCVGQLVRQMWSGYSQLSSSECRFHTAVKKLPLCHTYTPHLLLEFSFSKNNCWSQKIWCQCDPTE